MAKDLTNHGKYQFHSALNTNPIIYMNRPMYNTTSREHKIPHIIQHQRLQHENIQHSTFKHPSYMKNNILSSPIYSLSSPLIRRASCISLGIIVTRFPCIAQRLESSNNPTKCASAASCSANIADPCHRYGCLVMPYCISLTSLAKGRRRSNKFVED